MVKSLPIMVLFFLSAFLCCKQRSDSNIKNFHVEADQSIYAEARMFKREDISVMVADMVHVAPKEYFLRLKGYVEGFAKPDRVVLLQEFIYCQTKAGKTYEVVVAKFDPELFYDQAVTASDDQSGLTSFIGLLGKNFEKFLASGFLVEVPCRANDQTDGFVAYNNKQRVEAAQDGFSLQHDVFKDFSAHLKVVKADVNVTAIPESYKVLSALVFAMLNDNLLANAKFKIWAASAEGRFFMPAVNYFVYEYRENILMKNLAMQIAAGEKNIAMTWGGAHSEHIYENLKQQGFKQDDSKNILLASCQVISESTLSEIFVKACTFNN